MPQAHAEAHGQADLQEELVLEKYRCIINRLRLDILFFMHSLDEFTALGPESEESWEALVATAEAQLEVFASHALKQRLPSVSDIVGLLNCRDALVSELIDSILYQQAVLHAELGRAPAASDGRMAQLSELVRAQSRKMDKPPELYTVARLPVAEEDGPYAYVKSAHAMGNDVISQPSYLPTRFRAMFAEMHAMEKQLRRMKFGQTIQWRNGKHVKSEDIRQEITELFDKFSKLDHELQQSKASRHTPWDQRLELLTAKIAEKDLSSQTLLNQKTKLEHALQDVRGETHNVQKELSDLKERNQKVTNENLPRLAKIKVLLQETWSSVDSLCADAAMLSSMFRQQVEEHRAAVSAKDTVSGELNKVQKSLKRHRDEIMFKDDELQKKETLYQRTVDARRDIHESYLAQKDAIKDAEERHRKQNEEWEQLLAAAEDRNARLDELREQINTANQRIDLLEQQKKLYMEEFRKKTNKPCGIFLEQFKKPPQRDTAK